MTIEEYVTEIKRIARDRDNVTARESYWQLENWQDSFEDKLSPEEAWDEEQAAGFDPKELIEVESAA